MDDISPVTFLEHLFPQGEIPENHTPVLCHPASFIARDTGREVHYYKAYRGTVRNARRIPRQPAGWLYCVSTIEPRPDGRLKRTFEDIREAWALVLDDWGTKACAPADAPVAPSVLLETSPGNYQAVYFLEPFDVTSPAGQGYYDDCLVSCARAGLSDPGMRSATRVAKMPGAVHKSGFITRVSDWHPERVWDLRELMDSMGVEVKPGRRVRGALKPGKYTRLEQVHDENYDWLVANWNVLGHNDQWVFIECPWRAQHTDGAQGPTSTAYSPDEYGRAGAAFKCLHGHCAHRSTADLVNFITQKKRIQRNENRRNNRRGRTA